MGFNVEPYGGKIDPRSARLSRSGGGGSDAEKMQKLFEELMGGESGDGTGELKNFDWEELWNSFMEEDGGGGGGVPQQASNRPTMFGSPIRPGGFNTGIGYRY